MATGACGINCDICRLQMQGICSTCGPGGSEEAKKKLEAQHRILGAPCPILACAMKEGVSYCLKDCVQFPCSRFHRGPYPFSDGFLAMQERRRREAEEIDTPIGSQVQVPPVYWDELLKRDLGEIRENSLARVYPNKGPNKGIILSFLDEEIFMDVENRCLKRENDLSWKRIENPLLELIVLVYLLNAGPENVFHEMISVQELKEAHFFQGPHALDVSPLLRRFGRDVEAFRRSAKALGGRSLSMADAAFRFQALPKIPLYYLLWEGDEEFEPRLSILFDRSVEKHLSADAIWGLVRLVSKALLEENRNANLSHSQGVQLQH